MERYQEEVPKYARSLPYDASYRFDNHQDYLTAVTQGVIQDVFHLAEDVEAIRRRAGAISYSGRGDQVFGKGRSAMQAGAISYAGRGDQLFRQGHFTRSVCSDWNQRNIPNASSAD